MSRRGKSLPGQLSLFGGNVSEQATESTPEELTCSWKREGDFCLHPVEKDGDLCPHHQGLWKELKSMEAKKAKRKPKPEPEPELEAEESEDEPSPYPTRHAAAHSARSDNSNGAKKPSKYERQKRVIRLAAGSLLESGKKGGLTARQVETLVEMLDVLGFLQEGGDG